MYHRCERLSHMEEMVKFDSPTRARRRRPGRMNCRSLAIAGMLCGVSPAASQSFQLIAPLPTTSNLWDAAYQSDTAGWIVGDSHACYKTSDGGATWTRVNIPGYAGDPLYNITFVTPSLGFISGNSAQGSLDVYRTVDGGATWSRVNTFPLGGSWYHHSFLSSSVGYMGCNGALVKTTDGGATWQVRSGYPDCPVIYGMDFVSETTGLVAGNQVSTNLYGVFKTTDSGLTWQRKYSGASNDVVYLTSQVAIADSGTSIVRSNNGGDTWSDTGAVIATGLVDIEPLGEFTAVGVSANGTIWKTVNGGYDWFQVWVGEGDLPANWSVEFRTSLHGHVAGQAGLLYETFDGGTTWRRISRGVAKDWRGLAATWNDTVVAVGHHGYVQMSRDGGSAWSIYLLDPPYWLHDSTFNGVDVVGLSRVYVVGAFGGLFRSDDAGDTWQNLSYALNPDYYANAVEFVDENNGWIVGWDYAVGPKRYVRRTTDGGWSWNVVESANVPSIDVEFKGSRGWILTTGEPLWRTVDGGTNWSMVNLPSNSGASVSCSDMSWGNPNVGYVCGWEGYLVKSVNGGAAWTQVGAIQPQVVFLGVAARGEREVWICGARQGGGNAFVKRSLDGGATWRSWSLPGQYTSPVQIALTQRYVYVAGYAGEIWRLDSRNLAGPVAWPGG